MYKLIKHDTGRKANRYHYLIVKATGDLGSDPEDDYEGDDQQVEVLAERHSNRDYVAATIDGEFFFGRTDLINTGDHGLSVKRALAKGIQPTPIAHLKQ